MAMLKFMQLVLIQQIYKLAIMFKLPLKIIKDKLNY